MEFPSGILQVCGDSFAGQGVGFGGWYSPIALHVETDSIDDPTGVRYDGVTGTDKPLLADPTPAGHIAAARGRRADQPRELHDGDHRQGSAAAVVATGESRSGAGELADAARIRNVTPDSRAAGRARSAATTTRSRRPDSPTGWVYIVANNFDRTGPVGALPRQARDLHRPGELAGLVVVRPRRLEQAADAAVAGQGRRDEHSADRRQDGAVVLQRQQRQHGGAGRRQPHRTGHRAGDHRRVRQRMAGSRRGPAAARGSTGWPSRTAATSRRDPRSTRCACSSASGIPCRARRRRTASSSSR